MRATARLLLAVALLGAATLVLVPWNWLAAHLRLPGRAASAKAWNRIALFALGWRVRVEGTPLQRRPLLLVSNHVSWGDVVILAAYADAAFIAKSEVSGWPLFGLLARLHDTIFIERDQKRTAREQARAVAGRLERNKALVLFPEGTTADGNHLLPFKSSLFGAVAFAEQDTGAHVVVQPVAIAYTKLYGLPLGYGERMIAAWVGDAGLLDHLRLLFRHGPLDVTLRFGEPLASRGLGRKQMAHETEQRVQNMLAAALRG